MTSNDKLERRTWKEFLIGGNKGLFKIEATKSGIDKKNLNLDSRVVPYITRSEFNNGISQFVDEIQDQKYSKNSGNVIVIGLDTQTVFYQEYPFYTGQNIQVLMNENLNKSIALFLIPLLKIQMKKFNWGGNGATLSRLKKTKIMLPINENNEPDWQFMERYVQNIEVAQTTKLLGYFSDKIMSIKLELGDVKWSVFNFNEVFTEITRGKRLIKADQVVGDTPYVSSTSLNNGVDNFISNSVKIRKFQNTLTIANSGSVGSTFYHPYEFIASDHVTCLKIKNADKYVYLFIATIVRRLSEKYSFNREINDQRILKERLLLPIDDNGEPNWTYMSNYMKIIEQNKIQQITEYLRIEIIDQH